MIFIMMNNIMNEPEDLYFWNSKNVRSSSIFIPDQSSRESDNYNDNWSRIGQGSFSVDSDDSTDA